MDDHDLDICWAALAVAILSKRPKTPEVAFQLLEQSYKDPAQVRTETVRMMELSAEGLSYREIGEVYGISRGAVHKRISRYTEKTDGALDRVNI